MCARHCPSRSGLETTTDHLAFALKFGCRGSKTRAELSRSSFHQHFTEFRHDLLCSRPEGEWFVDRGKMSTDDLDFERVVDALDFRDEFDLPVEEDSCLASWNFACPATDGGRAASGNEASARFLSAGLGLGFGDASNDAGRSGWRCLDPSHSPECASCLEPPAVRDECRWELVGDPVRMAQTPMDVSC